MKFFYFRSKTLLALFLILFQFSLGEAFAISNSVRRYVGYETKSNAVAKRSNRPVELEHYEIPSRLIDVDIANRIPPEVKAALIFEKDGKDKCFHEKRI